MKLLQINGTFASGSTGKIVYAIHEYAKSQGDDSFVIYGFGRNTSDPNVFKTTPWIVRKAQSFRSRITGYPYAGCLWGTARALRIIKKIKPDVVHIQCINGYMVNIYRILNFLKSNHIPTVITNHAEFMYTGGCTHSINCNKWLRGCHDCDKINREHPISYFFDRTRKEWNLLQKAYIGFEKLIICCVSEWSKERASQSPFYVGYPVVTVLNGLDTSIFRYSNVSDLKKKHRLQGKKIVVHVTPNFFNVIKGGQHVLEMARRFPSVDFLIVGSDVDDGKMPSNCHFIGRVTDQRRLAQYYALGDVCLLTSVRETFSMVCAESLCCGTVVVGFKAGGPERISLNKYSTFVDQGDDDALEDALRRILEKRYSKQTVSEIAIKTYCQESMCKNYYRVYKTILGK